MLNLCFCLNDNANICDIFKLTKKIDKKFTKISKSKHYDSKMIV